MTKVEEVARAISAYLGENPDEHDDNVADGLFYANWTAHEGLARAAIKAMREPTPKMVDGSNAPDMPAGGGVVEVWQSMIDAALSEGEG